VLTGRCYERESMPYKALDPVIDSLCRHLLTLKRADLQAHLPADLGPLARLFPVLRRVEAAAGAAGGGPPPPPLELRRRALEALRELVARMSTVTPVVVHIDDLQWGDTDSALVIQELLRPPQAPRLLFIAGFRAEDSRTSPFLRALLPLASVPIEIEVAPLTRAESLVLGRRLLGPISDSLPAVCNSISRESGGNPFFLHELVQYVRTSAVGDISLGTISLEEVIRARLTELPSDARRLLDVVVLAGQPIAPAAARRAAELGDEYDGAVRLLRARKLIRARGGDERGAGAMEPYHDRICEVAVAVLPPEQRRDLHRALAVALSVEADPDPESLADHFEAAGEPERAAQLLISAAEHAGRALAFDRASRLYQRALAMRSYPAAEEVRLRGELARALGNAARGAEAAAAYLEAAQATSPVEGIEYRRMAAEHLLHVGHVDEGLELLGQVAGQVGLRLPRSRPGSLLTMLWNRARLRMRRLRYRVREAAEIAPSQLRRLDVCWSAAIGLAMVDPVSGVDFQTRHLLLCLRAGEPYRLARALALEIAYVCTTGVRSRTRCQRVAEVMAPLVERVDAPELRGWYLAVNGLAHYQWGEFAEAQRHAAEAAEILRNTAGLVFERTSNELYGLWSLYYLGEVGELARRVPRTLREAEDRGDRYTVANLSTGLCQLTWLVRDDLAGAAAASERAMQSWSHRTYHLQHYWHFIGRLQAALYGGDGEEAWRIYQEGWPGYRRSLFRRIEMVANEADWFAGRVHLAAGAPAGDPEERLRAAERLAAGMQRRGPSYAVATAQLIRAGVAARRGQPEAALELLGQAETGFAAASMGMHLRAARWRRGQLLGGAEGAALIAGVGAELEAQSVANPERMANLFAPGFD
jgi:eukaryotic-like serine/threonine-protein kinase